MNWEEMFAALKATGASVELCMRKPGDWYVSSTMDIPDGAILRGEYGNGRTPQEAVERHWAIYSKAPEVCISIPSRQYERKRLVWMGYMWRDITPVQKATV